jgi:hypothetical protein
VLIGQWRVGIGEWRVWEVEAEICHRARARERNRGQEAENRKRTPAQHARTSARSWETANAKDARLGKGHPDPEGGGQDAR